VVSLVPLRRDVLARPEGGGIPPLQIEDGKWG
jgi:hypothetical protein